MQILFQLDAQGDGFKEVLNEFLQAEQVAESDQPFVRELVQQTWTHRDQVDELISVTAKHWDLVRVAAIDRAILRLGVCELLYFDHAPPKVALNEAIELAKQFGTAESPHFVNGVLDAIWKKEKKDKGKEKTENGGCTMENSEELPRDEGIS